MNKIISFKFFLFACALFLFACTRKLSNQELTENLKAAMGQYLSHRPDIDTARVKFDVLEVVYFEAPKGYICDFKVNMRDMTKTPEVDTVGTMSANISKDFKNVKRRVN
jgi:hypothetical protein